MKLLYIYNIVFSKPLKWKVLTIILFNLGVWLTSLIMPNTNYDILMTELSSMALECALYHRNNKTITNGAQMLKCSGRGTTLLQQWKCKQMVSVNFNEIISVHRSDWRIKTYRGSLAVIFLLEVKPRVDNTS